MSTITEKKRRTANPLAAYKPSLGLSCKKKGKRGANAVLHREGKGGRITGK